MGDAVEDSTSTCGLELKCDGDVGCGDTGDSSRPPLLPAASVPSLPNTSSGVRDPASRNPRGADDDADVDDDEPPAPKAPPLLKLRCLPLAGLPARLTPLTSGLDPYGTAWIPNLVLSVSMVSSSPADWWRGRSNGDMSLLNELLW